MAKLESSETRIVYGTLDLSEEPFYLTKDLSACWERGGLAIKASVLVVGNTALDLGGALLRLGSAAKKTNCDLIFRRRGVAEEWSPRRNRLLSTSLNYSMAVGSPYNAGLCRHYKVDIEALTLAPPCSCDMQALMLSGCRCGALKREREACS